MPPFHPHAHLVPSLIAATRADCGMLAQVGSCATGGGGRGGGRYAGEAGGALVARVLRPARAEVVASYHRLHHPSVPLGLLLQAWWRCVYAHRLVRRRWFCSKPPSPSLTLPLAVPLFAHPQNQKPLRTSTCRRSRPRQPFASRSPSPCRYATVGPRNTTSAQELGFRARGFTQTSQSWSGSRMLGEPGLDQRNLWLGSHNLG